MDAMDAMDAIDVPTVTLVFFDELPLGVVDAVDVQANGAGTFRQRNTSRFGRIPADVADGAGLQLASFDAGVRFTEGRGAERIAARHRRTGRQTRRVRRTLHVALQCCKIHPSNH